MMMTFINNPPPPPKKEIESILVRINHIGGFSTYYTPFNFNGVLEYGCHIAAETGDAYCSKGPVLNETTVEICDEEKCDQIKEKAQEIINAKNDLMKVALNKKIQIRLIFFFI